MQKPKNRAARPLLISAILIMPGILVLFLNHGKAESSDFDFYSPIVYAFSFFALLATVIFAGFYVDQMIKNKKK